MFSERAGQSFSDFKTSLSSVPQSISAMVGSEGGWTDEEIAQARDAAWTIITLGGRILRAETSAIAVAVLRNTVGVFLIFSLPTLFAIR